jgi:hypothetical protein
MTLTPPPTLPTTSTSRIQKEESTDDDINDPLLDHKLDVISARARPYLKEHPLNKISRENCLTIINYILAMQTETTLSDSYRLDPSTN